MKALALLEARDHVCGRYRIRAFAPALHTAGWSLDVHGLARGPLKRAFQLRKARDYDAVILQRKLLPSWQWAILRKSSRRLIFDFDDAILYRDSYDRRGPHSARRASRFARTVSEADAVLAGNDFLAETAIDDGAKPERVRVIPTCIEIDKYPPKTTSTNGPVRLVWIGSSSTLKGLEIERSLFEDLGRAIPGLLLRVIADRFPQFESLPVEPIAWNEANEATDLAEADIGISLLPDDLWSQGKCGLKVLQYQASGLPVVANPVGVHPKMIDPGRTGFLPITAEAWISAIRSLANDPALRLAMGRAARANVEANYSVDAWSPAFVAAITGARPSPAPKMGLSLARKVDAQ